ncbi:MAG: sugar ABC transporter permease [Clostridia bacterium]|nr:sugar ABC transporter permease [Clostridia bacterium]
MTAVKSKKRKSAKKRRKIVSLDKKKARAGWLFVLPFIIGLVLIYLPIIFDSINYSLNEIVPIPFTKGGGYELKFVGLKHYHAALTEDPKFSEILITGIKDLVFDIPAIVIFSLFVAVLLNKKILGRAAFRAIFFIPVILSTGLINEISGLAAAGQDYMSQTGTVDDGSGSSASGGVSQIVSVTDFRWLFQNMQVGNGLLKYVTNIVNDIYNIINRSGVQMLIFLAGLQSISPAIYESCSIDGATGWETFWKITFPMISPMILVNSIYTVIDSFTSSDSQIMTYIKSRYGDVANGGGREIATAMSWIYFLLVIGIIALVAGALSAYIFYQRRD